MNVRGLRLLQRLPLLMLCWTGLQTGHAHHGWSTYQSSVSLTGTVREINFGNAHDQLVLVDDEDRAWAILLAPPQRNRRMGFDASSIAVDQVLTLHGERHYKQEVLEIKTERIERDGEEIYRYPGR